MYNTYLSLEKRGSVRGVNVASTSAHSMFDPRVPNAHPSQVFDPHVCEALWREPSSLGERLR